MAASRANRGYKVRSGQRANGSTRRGSSRTAAQKSGDRRRRK